MSLHEQVVIMAYLCPFELLVLREVPVFDIFYSGWPEVFVPVDVLMKWLGIAVVR